MTDDQIEAAFEAVVGLPPRGADLAVLKVMGADVDTVAEYLWDHWLGEPDEPTLEEVAKAVRAAVEVKR